MYFIVRVIGREVWRHAFLSFERFLDNFCVLLTNSVVLWYKFCPGLSQSILETPVVVKRLKCSEITEISLIQGDTWMNM